MQLVSKLKYQVTATALLAISAVLFFTVQSVFADSASMFLDPGSKTLSQGDTLSVNVYVNSSEPVNAASARLAYQPSLLDFVNIEPSASFNIAAEGSGGGGNVRIDRGALPAVSGRQLLATVNFKVKGSSGLAAINFTDGSAIVSANSNHNILGGAAGGRYSIGDSVTSPRPPTTQPTHDNTGGSGEPLEGSKLNYCKDHEQDINNILSRIVDRGRKQLVLYNSVSESTQSFYSHSAKKISNYNSLLSAVNNKKSTALVSVSSLEASSKLFSCDGSNPKAQLTEFKNELTAEINALTAYRSSVKDLVVAVRSAQ
jgi:hypothetical protein